MRVFMIFSILSDFCMVSNQLRTRIATTGSPSNLPQHQSTKLLNDSYRFLYARSIADSYVASILNKSNITVIVLFFDDPPEKSMSIAMFIECAVCQQNDNNKSVIAQAVYEVSDDLTNDTSPFHSSLQLFCRVPFHTQFLSITKVPLGPQRSVIAHVARVVQFTLFLCIDQLLLEARDFPLVVTMKDESSQADEQQETDGQDGYLKSLADNLPFDMRVSQFLLFWRCQVFRFLKSEDLLDGGVVLAEDLIFLVVFGSKTHILLAYHCNFYQVVPSEFDFWILYNLNIEVTGMDKYFVDVKEFTKPRYTRSNYIPDELHTDVLRKGHAMPQLNRRSSELRKHSGSKRIIKDNRDDYETDCRRKGQLQADFELEELRRLVSECQHCRSRLPQFVTKKPQYHEQRHVDASTQATFDTTLLQLLQEKMDQIRRYSKQQSKQLSKMKQLVEMKEDELDDMEQRFTAVVYKVSEDIFLFERVLTECHHLKVLASLNSEAPSFLKCMAMDESIQAAGHG